jgi:hypothetical protein
VVRQRKEPFDQLISRRAVAGLAVALEETPVVGDATASRIDRLQ